MTYQHRQDTSSWCFITFDSWFKFPKRFPKDLPLLPPIHQLGSKTHSFFIFSFLRGKEIKTTIWVFFRPRWSFCSCWCSTRFRNRILPKRFRKCPESTKSVFLANPEMKNLFGLCRKGQLWTTTKTRTASTASRPATRPSSGRWTIGSEMYFRGDGLVVMGDESCSRGRWFESGWTWHFSHWSVVKIVLFVWKEHK